MCAAAVLDYTRAMPKSSPNAPSPIRSLSARLLLLTIIFVLFGEVLIYVPSIARYRAMYLQERLAAGQLATLAVEASPTGHLEPALEGELLKQADLLGVALRRPEASILMIGNEMPEHIDATFDLRQSTPIGLIRDAFEALAANGQRMIRVLGASEHDPRVTVDVALSERSLWLGMVDYSRRILNLSVVLSLITAALVYFSLQWLMVRPTRIITENLVAFRRNPGDASTTLQPSNRADEIGLLERELAEMQRDIRHSLVQNTRLAALGASMSRINHDLRNSLASAMVVSDSLAQSEDPEVQKVTPRLMAAIDRAVKLCSQTLDYARSREPELHPERVDLHALVSDVRDFVAPPAGSAVDWDIGIEPGFVFVADKNQMFRVLLNLASNAAAAMPGGGTIRFRAERKGGWIAVDIADEGGGIPPKAQETLFEPFMPGAGRGTGLGLAIAKELMRAHGGDITLMETSKHGTRFRLRMPDRA